MIYPHPQIYHDHLAIFVHVPKTGGTSIEQTLKSPAQIVGGHTTAMGFQSKFPDEFMYYFKFAVLRDPVERFLSGYSYLRHSKVHPNLGNQIVHDAESLEDFAAMVMDDPMIAQKNVHLMPQSQFVCDHRGSIMVDYLCRYDGLEDEWKYVCKVLDVDLKLPRLNRSMVIYKPTDLVEQMCRQIYPEDYKLLGCHGHETKICYDQTVKNPVLTSL